MIGFYLTVNKNANSRVKLLSRQYESPTDLDAPGEQGLHIFNDERSQIAQSNGYTTFNIGTVIYKNKWQKKALELIIRDLNNGKAVREIMPNTRGQFCLIVHTVRNVFVIIDKLGSFPVYIFEDNDTIQISNILLLLAKNNNVTVDYQAFAEYLSFDYCFDCTFFNEIELLDRGSIYQFTPTLKVQVYDDFLSGIVFNKYNNLDEICHLTTETLQHNLSFLNANDRIFVDITGGFDTRTNAVILASLGIDFESGICGEQVLGESELAEKVAHELGAKFHSRITISDKDTFERVLERHYPISAGVPILYHSTQMINYYEYIRRQFDIHITGFAGTQLFDQFLPRLSLLTSRLRPAALFEKAFKFKDIIRNNLMTQTSYCNALAEKTAKLLENINSDIHDEVACFLPLAIFNRYYHGTLAGAHNTLMPFYSPYLEGDIARLMIETSYKLKKNRTIQRALLTKLNRPVSLIMTSHGYNANLGSEGTRYPIKRSKEFVKNLARQMAYDAGFLLRIVRWAENLRGKIKPLVDPAEFQRPFWVNEVNNEWSDDMEIFELIDRGKLNKRLVGESDAPKLKAKTIMSKRFHLISLCSARRSILRTPNTTSPLRGVKSKPKIIIRWSKGMKQTAITNGSRKYFRGMANVKTTRTTVIMVVSGLIIWQT